MESIEQIKARLQGAFPSAALEIVANDSPCAQLSLVVDVEYALAIARWLRDDPELRLDYASNVTGIDRLDRVEETKRQVKQMVEGEERLFEETIETAHPGFLEVVYHLYSMSLKHGPVVIRLRSSNRAAPVQLPSLTPIWRGCELQEREVYDLFGIEFVGHPDLRRILMWDEFEDYPMRRDYAAADDYEYEPTPHGDVLEHARARYPEEGRQ